MAKRLVVDLDGTLTIDELGVTYADKLPNLQLISRLREYKAQGFEIIICTARNMRTFSGSIGKINAHTLPEVVAWLKKNNVPFDEIHVGKPWCGNDGFYIDDKAVRPSEFKSMDYREIREMLLNETVAMIPASEDAQ